MVCAGGTIIARKIGMAVIIAHITCGSAAITMLMAARIIPRSTHSYEMMRIIYIYENRKSEHFFDFSPNHPPSWTLYIQRSKIVHITKFSVTPPCLATHGDSNSFHEMAHTQTRTAIFANRLDGRHNEPPSYYTLDALSTFFERYEGGRSTV